MEKKVYKINVWNCGEYLPENLRVLPRYDYDDKCDAVETFVGIANRYLHEGCAIAHITHVWNYEFKRPDGSRFDLYMFED